MLEEVNSIKSKYNLVSSIPDKVHPTKYSNIKQGELCSKAISTYNSNCLKIRSAFQQGSNISKQVIEITNKIIDTYEDLDKVQEPGSIKTSAGKSNNSNNYTSCLENLNALDSVVNTIKNIPSYLNDIISEALKPVESKIKDYLSSLLSDDYSSGTFEGLKEIRQGIKSLADEVMELFNNVYDTAIFPILDALEEFLEQSALNDLISKTKEMEECIKKECKEGAKSMMDLDSILYVQGNPNKGYKIPITGTKEFRLNQLPRSEKDLVGTSNLSAPHRKERLELLQKRYNSYKSNKNKVSSDIKTNILSTYKDLL